MNEEGKETLSEKENNGANERVNRENGRERKIVGNRKIERNLLL